MRPATRANIVSYRMAACTHIRTSRLYSEESPCDYCGNPGTQGWVYRCTQDSDGRIPLCESGIDDQEQERLIQLAKENGWNLPGVDPSYSEKIFRAEDDVDDITSLKPWMIKAIAAGHYSPEQIEKLISQRKNVKAIIKGDELRAVFKDEKKMNNVKQRVKSKINPGHNTVDIALDGMQERSSSELPEYDFSWESLESSLEAYRKASVCQHRCCSVCRPIMRDRAWLPMDSILRPEDPDAFPQDIDVRPLAAANIVLGIGTHEAILSPSSSQSSLSSFSVEGACSREDDDHVSRRRSLSFSESFQQVMSNYTDHGEAGPMGMDIDNFDESQSSATQDPSDIHQNDKSAALEVPRPASRIDQNWVHDAINTSELSHLPPGLVQYLQEGDILDQVDPTRPHQTGTTTDQPNEDNLRDELQVPGGVALTEEAVDLGIADLITQA